MEGGQETFQTSASGKVEEAPAKHKRLIGPVLPLDQTSCLVKSFEECYLQWLFYDFKETNKRKGYGKSRQFISELHFFTVF